MAINVGVIQHEKKKSGHFNHWLLDLGWLLIMSRYRVFMIMHSINTVYTNQKGAGREEPSLIFIL